MKIKTEKNKYGWWKAICPFCEMQCRMNYRNEEKSLDGIKRHMKNYAQKEAFLFALDDIKETPHLAYYKKHTSMKPKTPVELQRDFDEDMEI